MSDKIQKPRDKLSLEEQEFLNKKAIWMKWLSVFLTWIWLLWSRRRWAFFLCIWIAFICWYVWWEWWEVIAFVVTRCITLIKFTEKAYNHGVWQWLVDKYREEHSSNKKVQWWKTKAKKENTK